MAKTKTSWKRPTNKAPLRTRAQIQAEYDRAANHAGDIQYKVFAMNQVLTQINTRMFELNQEFQTLAPEVVDNSKAVYTAGETVQIVHDDVETSNVEAASECPTQN